jgi:hypothetical protein
LIVLLLLISPASESVAHPGWGIVVDKKGNVFFGDVNHNIVWKVDSRGTVTRFVVSKHSHILTLDDAGTLYGQHIEYVSRNDTWLIQYWKASADGNVSNMTNAESHNVFDLRDRTGNTYVLDSDAHKRVARIYKVTPRGDTMLFAGGKWGDEDG